MPSPQVIVPDKCIFYLDGTKECTGKWKLTSIDDVDVVDKRYTSKSDDGVVHFSAKKNIQNPSGAYSASLFAKRNEIKGNGGYEEVGFYFNDGVSLDCGYRLKSSIYIDDRSTGANTNTISLASIISGKELNTFFMTFCKDTDGTSYITLDGKLLHATNTLTSPVNFFETITLFNADGYGGIVGWVDKVVIHKDICLYKEDFTVLPMDQYPKYKLDDDSLRLY